MKLGTKLVACFLGCGLVPLLVVAYVSYSTADDGMGTIRDRGSAALEKNAYDQLTALRDVKKKQIESFFDERQADMGVLAETVGTLRAEAFAKLESIQKVKKSFIENYLNGMKQQLRVVKDDPYTAQALLELEKAFEEGGGRIDTPQWKTLAEKYEGRMRDLMEDNGWYDLFLVHPDGNIVYTVARESDLGMTIPNSELRDSPMGDAFAKARKMRSDEIVVADFAPYAPSNGAPAGFMMGQMHDEAGKLAGYVAFQIPIDKINEIMLIRDGMGETGESYLVGQDLLMRSDSFLNPDKYSVEASFKSNNRVDTEATRGALAGGEDQKIIGDYNGNPVLSCWNAVEIGSGVRWAMMSEMDVAEAFCPKDESGTYFFSKYTDLYGYYDLFLLNPDGYCFYTVGRESDYQTNLINGKYSDSSLGKAVRQCLDTRRFTFGDFEPYAPSNGVPAAFLAQPIVYDGNIDMIVALQLSDASISEMMAAGSSKEKTLEAYLVGADGYMRSDSILNPDRYTVAASFVQGNKVNTDATRGALSGTTEAKVIEDYLGSSVLSAWAPLDILGTKWALVCEIDEAVAMAAVTGMNETADAAGTTLLTWVGMLAVGAVIVVTAVSLIITRGITRPFREIFRGLKTFSPAELKETAKTFNRIIEGMSENAAQVTDGSNQVSTSAQELAAGASEQASSLEETSSALEQMAAMTRTNAQNAKQANELSGSARAAAEEGDRTMHQLNQAMTGINESSGQISKIIKVIEEIAFQTNLLALNAAVEAARAGEHGKGFAVVADEVRNLAQRAAQAARETTGLIEDSVLKAKEGADVADEVGKALSVIVSDVSKVTGLIEGIARASEEQAQGVEQVNTAVSQMDQVTQQNAAGAEESAAAAEEMSAQAQAAQILVNELVQMVKGTTNETTTVSAPPMAAAAPPPQAPQPTAGVTRLHREPQRVPVPVAASAGSHYQENLKVGGKPCDGHALLEEDRELGDF